MTWLLAHAGTAYAYLLVLIMALATVLLCIVNALRKFPKPPRPTELPPKHDPGIWRRPTEYERAQKKGRGL